MVRNFPLYSLGQLSRLCPLSAPSAQKILTDFDILQVPGAFLFHFPIGLHASVWRIVEKRKLQEDIIAAFQYLKGKLEGTFYKGM